MSTNIPSVAYTYPIPKCLGDMAENTTSQLQENFRELFENYDTIKRNLLLQLNRIFFGGGDEHYVDFDEKGHISLADFIKKAAEGGFKAFYDCDESTSAYKFYGCQIIDEINNLSDYVKEAKKILDKWNYLFGGDLNSLIHSDVVRLECLAQFCSEIHKNFGARYYYDFEEDNWKLAEDDYLEYRTEAPKETYEQIDDHYPTYDDLYNTRVKCDYKANPQPPDPKKILDCFNELNLLDRLKYIKVYYDIESGKTNYVFPEGKEVGFPCASEDDIKLTDTRIARLEKFYLGYLIDRDGPINAFCSLYEIKVRALQETLNELQKRITSFNTYLEFVNLGLDLLNQSQSAGKHRVPDGVLHALTYICGQKMYNLYEAPNGKKYIVLPVINDDGQVVENKYNLFAADESGKKVLLGDEASGKEHAGNASFACKSFLEGGDIKKENFSKLRKLQKAGSNNNKTIILNEAGDDLEGEFPTCFNIAPGESLQDKYGFHSGKIIEENVRYPVVGKILSKEEAYFELPKELDVAAIVPTSVKHYHKAHWDAEVREDGFPYDAMIESWTAAFNKKIEFINDGIQLVNIDIEQIRSKINTYQSQASTFRSRVHDVYVNAIRKVKSR